ncbi:hypothetical protein FWG86_01990 [Candidatus Saccharibacteria bacterium]|nr:hypothetical protein [Candidatus Saccharibacteria bacterium]
MSVGRGNLSVNAEIVMKAAEATVEKHPEWLNERSEEAAIAEVMRVIECKMLMFITNRGGWRDKLKVLSEKDIKQAINELAHAAYRPAIIALNSKKSSMGGAGSET